MPAQDGEYFGHFSVSNVEMDFSLLEARVDFLEENGVGSGGIGVVSNVIPEGSVLTILADQSLSLFPYLRIEGLLVIAIGGLLRITQ